MTAITFRTDDVHALADRLGRVTAVQLGLGALEAVNDVTTRFDAKAQRGMTEDYALEPAYVRSKTDLRLAKSPLRPIAEIEVKGKLTILGRFPIQQRYVAAGPAWENKKRGTTRGGPSLGDKKRGIPPGMKQAGVGVTIRRSAPSQPVGGAGKWFTMTLRRGAEPGANVGVFVRRSRNSVSHIYGLSPYSMFRHQVRINEAGLRLDLAATAADKIIARVERSLR